MDWLVCIWKACWQEDLPSPGIGWPLKGLSLQDPQGLKLSKHQNAIIVKTQHVNLLLKKTEEDQVYNSCEQV